MVDDHQMFREGIKSLIEEEAHLKVVHEAANGQQALDLLSVHRDDIHLVIIDIHMPVMGGVACMRHIRKNYADLPVLALTMADEEVQIKQMLKAGANGYILKNAGKAELVNAISKLVEGELYFSQHVTNIIMNDLVGHRQQKAAAPPPAEILSEREIEVLKLIVQEYSNREISDKLSISVRTVDAHKRNLLQKTGARNTAGLTRYAIEYHLIDL